MSKASGGNSIRPLKTDAPKLGNGLGVLRFLGGFRNPPGAAQKLIAILEGRAGRPAAS